MVVVGYTQFPGAVAAKAVALPWCMHLEEVPSCLHVASSMVWLWTRSWTA